MSPFFVCPGSLTRFKIEGYAGYAFGPRSLLFVGWIWTFVRKADGRLLVSFLLPIWPDDLALRSAEFAYLLSNIPSEPILYNDILTQY
jgi:hypothetical protein